jgi:hypothetical protein
LDPHHYSGNPALKVPTLETADGAWFGALNICRELRRLSPCEVRIVWPEDLRGILATNAQELAVHAMGTEVTLIMSSLVGEATHDAVRDLGIVLVHVRRASLGGEHRLSIRPVRLSFARRATPSACSATSFDVLPVRPPILGPRNMGDSRRGGDEGLRGEQGSPTGFPAQESRAAQFSVPTPRPPGREDTRPKPPPALDRRP